MKVVIVAKTRRGKGACVGGLTFDGRSLRLEAAEANELAGLEYGVGEVWDIDAVPAPDLIPPHVETVHVHAKRRLAPIDDAIAFVERNMAPEEGGTEVLYQGLTQSTKAGALYIAERTGVPPFSTMFWRPDAPLTREHTAKRIHYRYPTTDGGRTLTFVGFQEPLEIIEPGTLLRVSLAHWWRPTDMPEGELRCYVQLSGWFLPEPDRFWAIEPVVSSTLPSGSKTRQPRNERQIPPDMDSARDVLSATFGFDEFWPLQEEVIASILARTDTLAVMPTGSGKSLCFQLPALLFDGLTVVVSPLISLMQDQVDQLREMDIAAVYLNSSLSHTQYVRTTNQIRQGQVKLLYVAPETLLRPETLLLLEQCRVDCLTVDEAHCISAWGHDFRPEYRQLRDVRQRLSGAVCFALTATATPRVQQDILVQLGIEHADKFVASFDRPNLFLSVVPKEDGRGQLLEFLSHHPDQSGIIYCATRRQVDALAADLAQQGYSVLPYHAGLDDLVRRRHQRLFSRDDVQIIVATVAFGMGIDKSNVRFVVHYDLPKDIESYYQEIGRAGRDGLRADCLLLFSPADLRNIQYFLEEKEQSQRISAQARLEALVTYAGSGACRRKMLLPYFGDPYSKSACGMCDNCLDAPNDEDLVDVTVQAQMFLSCVKRTGERFGANHIVNVLRGSREKRVLEMKHDKLSTYAIGKDMSQKEWSHLARQFVEQGLLERDMGYGGLRLTPKAYQVFAGEQVRGRPFEESPKVARTPEAAIDYDSELFSLLRAKRKELADADGVPPYVIFSDRTLVEIAVYYPQSNDAFEQMFGVGQAKLEKYAGQFLPLILEYCQARGIKERRKSDGRQTRSKKASGRMLEVAKAYQAGESMYAIASRLGIKHQTVAWHLFKYMQAGNHLKPAGILDALDLSEAQIAEGLSAFAEYGTDFLRPVYDALEQRFSYNDLHLLRLYFLARIG